MTLNYSTVELFGTEIDDENLQKRALRFLLNDYESAYEQLLNKAGRSSISINRLRTLCAEIYKAFNELNLGLMKNVFTVKVTNRLIREQYKLNFNPPFI